MALPIITYASTGSDTGASGSGAPATPLANTSTVDTANGVGGSTTITFNAEVDLTGINNDRSDVIYIAHAVSGEKHLFAIDSVSPNTTHATSLSVNSAIGVTGFANAAWAIGGSRQTFLHHTDRPDFQDGQAGWIFALTSGESFHCNTEIDVTNTGIQSGAQYGPVIVRSTIINEKAIITCNTDIQMFSSTNPTSLSQHLFQDIEFRRTGGTVSGTKYMLDFNWGNGSNLYVTGCILDGNSAANQQGIFNTGATTAICIFDTEFRNMDVGLDVNLHRGPAAIINSSFHDMATNAISINPQPYQSQAIINCVFYDMPQVFSQLNSGQPYNCFIINCVFDDITNEIFEHLAVNNSGVNVFNAVFNNIGSLADAITADKLLYAQFRNNLVNNLTSGFGSVTENFETRIFNFNNNIEGADPKFVRESTGTNVPNYAPQTGSPLINAGVPKRNK